MESERRKDCPAYRLIGNVDASGFLRGVAVMGAVSVLSLRCFPIRYRAQLTSAVKKRGHQSAANPVVSVPGFRPMGAVRNEVRPPIDKESKENAAATADTQKMVATAK